jgi:UrcA family protein
MKTALLSALAVLSIAGPALAAPRADMAPAPSMSIAYSDLDLGQAKDAATMLKRIRHAAGQVCSQTPGNVGNDPETIARNVACYRRTVARAVAGLNAPKVSALYGLPLAPQHMAELP